MGIFYTMATLVNRAPVDLTVMFDGQCKTLTPGPNTVPACVVQFAKNQNPIMGKADPNNPHISGGEYLVGVAADLDDVEPLTAEEWAAHLGEPARINSQEAFQERYGQDPKAKLVTLGKGRKSTAKSLYEAGGTTPQRPGNVTADFENDKP